MTMFITLLVCAVLISGAILAHAIMRARVVREAPAPAPAGTFDEHAAATALLRPAYPALPDADAVHIAAVTARAVDNLASVLVAGRWAMPADERHRLVEAMYADLHASLTPPQLARALLIALRPEAGERATALVDQFRSLPSTQES